MHTTGTPATPDSAKALVKGPKEIGEDLIKVMALSGCNVEELGRYLERAFKKAGPLSVDPSSFSCNNPFLPVDLSRRERRDKGTG
jgi:hypothetical protein